MKIKIVYTLNGKEERAYFDTEQEMMEWLDENEIYQYEKSYIVYKD